MSVRLVVVHSSVKLGLTTSLKRVADCLVLTQPLTELLNKRYIRYEIHKSAFLQHIKINVVGHSPLHVINTDFGTQIKRIPPGTLESGFHPFNIGVNWGGKLQPDGSTLLAKNDFIYGGAVAVELKSFITGRIVLVAHVRERVLWGCSLGNFSTQFGLGVKFIINWKRYEKVILVCGAMMTIVLGFSSYEDDLDVQQAYSFTIKTMPLPTKIVECETVEIRCELKREGRFSDARYTIRYFQPDGNAE